MFYFVMTHKVSSAWTLLFAIVVICIKAVGG